MHYNPLRILDLTPQRCMREPKSTKLDQTIKTLPCQLTSTAQTVILDCVRRVNLSKRLHIQRADSCTLHPGVTYS